MLFGYDGKKDGIQLEEICMSTNESAQPASRGKEIGIPLEDISMITKKGEQAATKGEEIEIPTDEISMITKRSEQESTTGNLDFKEDIAVFCTKTTCKTELFSGSNFCHKCGQEINKKQGTLNSNDFGENIPMFCINTNCKTELVCGSNFCHKCGQEINKKQGIESDLKMAQAAKEKVFKSLDIDEIANTLDSDGRKEEFRKIYQEKIESWKVKDVKFCITGASRTGKSSFINAITGCQEGQKGFAPVSVYGDTTNKGACYIHPKHSKLQLWDLPRFGTVQHKSKGYVNDMEFKKFDYVLIFFEVMSENDIWLAKQLKSHMKSFCFVRSKLDQDKTNDKQHDCNTIAYKIRTKALGDLEKEQISGVDVFVISSADTTIGHFESLINHIENNLDEGK